MNFFLTIQGTERALGT